MSSPWLFVLSGVCSKILEDAYGCGLRVDLEGYIEKHHYRQDDSGLLSFKVPLSKTT